MQKNFCSVHQVGLTEHLRHSWSASLIPTVSYHTAQELISHDPTQNPHASSSHCQSILRNPDLIDPLPCDCESQRLGPGSPTQSGTRKYPWLAMNVSIHGQVRLRSVCIMQRWSPEEPSWPTGKAHDLWSVRKSLRLGHGVSWGGERRWERIPDPLKGSKSCFSLLQ